MTRASSIGLGSVAFVVIGGLLIVSLMRHGALGPAATSTALSLPLAAAPTVRPSPEPESPRAVGPSFDAVRVGPQGQAVIAGRAAPHAEVTVTDDGHVIGRVTADGSGEWVLLPTEPLESGAHVLALSATSPGAAVAADAEHTLALLVPPRSTGEGAMALLLPQSGGPARALRLDQLPPRPPHAVTLDLLEYDAAGRLSLSGRADPGSELRVFLDDRLAGRGVAGADGHWSATLGDDVPANHYQLRLEALGAGGIVVGRLSVPLQREAPDVAARGAIAESYAVQPGNSLWRIARRSYGNGLNYVELYRANRTQIANPDLIYPGQVLTLPVATH